ncbi:MAG: YqgE/AlgH family protein [Yoonia sp.]|uniref:YqgE/AlgH family protein n=1 Tax=Yoonia sp. TaxID=2212373 RepID=UPI0032678BB0
MTMQPTNLTGKLLIAMPIMGDDRFAKSVVYICAHSEDGAMGIIVNKPSTEVRFANLLEQLEIEMAPTARKIRIHLGGPVEQSRGFVLHSTDYASEGGTIEVDDNISMTATMDVIEEIARGAGPTSAMMALGYAGWGPGQLEGEIGQNGWLTCDADDDIVFGRANDHKWTAALKGMGVDPLMLSETAGRA